MSGLARAERISSSDRSLVSGGSVAGVVGELQSTMSK